MKRTLLSVLLAAALYGPVQAKDFCADEELEQFVLLQLYNNRIAGGLDAVYPVEVRPALIREVAETEPYKLFNFYKGLDDFGTAFPDGRRYAFVDEDRGEQVLYKRTGAKKQRVTLFKVELPRIRLHEIKQELRATDRKLYTALGLDTKLEVVGVMGIIFRGGRGTVDFINTLKVDQPGLPGLQIAGADAVLYRYAVERVLEGVSGNVEGGELGDSKAFATVLRKKDEKTLLTGVVPGGSKTYYQRIMEGAGGPANHDLRLSQFADHNSFKLSSSGIRAADVQYRFVACKPNGADDLQAKAVFVPAKVGGKYPLLVYPGAFTDLDTLRMSLERAHAQAWWWNAVLNPPASTTDPEAGKKMREYLLRLPAPQWVWSSLRSTVTPSGGAARGAEKIMDANAMGRSLVQSTLDRLRARIHGLEAHATEPLPGVPDNGLLRPISPPPPPLGETPTSAETQARHEKAAKMQADAWYGQAIQISHPAWLEGRALTGTEAKAYRVALIRAIANGYAGTKEDRNTVLTTQLTDLQAKIAGEITSAQMPSTTDIRHQYDDLEWLHLQSIRLDGAFVDGMRLLNGKVKSLQWPVDAHQTLPTLEVGALIDRENVRLTRIKGTEVPEVHRSGRRAQGRINLSDLAGWTADMITQCDAQITRLGAAASETVPEKKAAMLFAAMAAIDALEMQTTQTKVVFRKLRDKKRQVSPERRRLAEKNMTRVGYAEAALEAFLAKGDQTPNDRYLSLKQRLIDAGMTVTEKQP